MGASVAANFESLSDMFAAGYAVQAFNINSDVHNWRFRDEMFRTFGVPALRNRAPDVLIARIEDVRKGAL